MESPFIKLTSEATGKPLYVNYLQVDSFSAATRHTGSCLYFGGDNTPFNVQETPNEILAEIRGRSA